MTKWLKKSQPEIASLLIIIAFFTFFFWPATLAGRFFVGGDALVYSYPLRTVMWQMICRGQLPLWTPTILSGYPLLSMSQLGLGYPLTWFYLILPGYTAEQIYVLAPFLLAPIFTYLYVRQIGRSRAASLLAGLGFGYGGLMASQIATYGMLPNAVMWLPLTLMVIERSRSKSFSSSLLWMSLAYAMSVFSGLGQGFLYVGIVAISYSVFLSISQPSHVDGAPAHNPPSFFRDWLRRLQPLIVCLLGMALAACLAAFQIFETIQAQRLSIRSQLTYEMFGGGAFTLTGAWRSFIAPFYHFLEEETFVASLAALMALVAIITAFMKSRREARVVFWIVVAALSFVLMLGDNTPLYRLLYHIPLINLFRVPARHAFEWTFSLAILAAFGWDQTAKLFQPGKEGGAKRFSLLLSFVLAAAGLAIGYQWWVATGQLPSANSPVQHTGLSEQGWLAWKLAFTVTIAFCVLSSLRLANNRWRSAFLAFAVLAGCFVEPYILLQRWWFNFAKPSSYFTAVSPATRFLQQYAPEQSRIYTSLTPGYSLEPPGTEPHNLTVRRGFRNAAGYEPLMPARYDKAFGNGKQFFTANFKVALDRQILSPDWQVLDLLNVHFLVEFSPTLSDPMGAFTEKDGARFAAADTAIDLKPGGTAVLTGAATMDTLTIVSVLANSSDLNDGSIVAQISLITTDGRLIKRELQAGRDSAEWAHEYADVKTTIRHSLARIFDTRQADGYSVHRYWSRFDLGERVDVDRVEITNIATNASLVISKTTAYDSNDNKALSLTQRLPGHWRKIYDYDNVQIYENPRALPRAWLVPKAKVVSEEEALKSIRGESNQRFDPHQVALIELPDPPAMANQAFPDGQFATASETRIVKYEPNHLVIETNADKQGLLVVSEMNYPGWEATIDGQSAIVFKTNYLLRGVGVPEGNHRVEMRYTAPAARIGGLISAMALLLIVGLAIKARNTNKPYWRIKND